MKMKRKKIRWKKKKETISSLKKKLDSVFSKYIRLKYADPNWYVACYTCWKRMPRKEIQCWHFFSRRHNATRRDEDNCRPQCYSCNIMKWWNYIVYTRKMIKEYWEKFIDELERKAHSVKRYTKQELKEMIEYYEKKVEELEKNLNTKKKSEWK